MITLIQGEYEKAISHYKSTMLKDYFEFHFVYTSANEVFRELDRFIWESRHQKTRFKNQYKGPVLIDLTEWNGNDINEYFEAFLYYLKDHSYLECTFIVQNLCEECFLDKLNEFFEIDVVELDIRKDKEKKRRIGFYLEEGVEGNVRS